jgi:hypothetical protein
MIQNAARSLWHTERTIRKTSMRSAKRNFNQINQINQNSFYFNILTILKTLTVVFLSICSLLLSTWLSLLSSFLWNHWRQSNKLYEK